MYCDAHHCITIPWSQWSMKNSSFHWTSYRWIIYHLYKNHTSEPQTLKLYFDYYWWPIDSSLTNAIANTENNILTIQPIQNPPRRGHMALFAPNEFLTINFGGKLTLLPLVFLIDVTCIISSTWFYIFYVSSPCSQIATHRIFPDG